MTEICVLCRKDTGVLEVLSYDDPTRNDARDAAIGSHYVEGCGQLCDKCWDETYLDHVSIQSGVHVAPNPLGIEDTDIGKR